MQQHEKNEKIYNKNRNIIEYIKNYKIISANLYDKDKNNIINKDILYHIAKNISDNSLRLLCTKHRVLRLRDLEKLFDYMRKLLTDYLVLLTTTILHITESMSAKTIMYDHVYMAMKILNINILFENDELENLYKNKYVHPNRVNNKHNENKKRQLDNLNHDDNNKKNHHDNLNHDDDNKKNHYDNLDHDDDNENKNQHDNFDHNDNNDNISISSSVSTSTTKTTKSNKNIPQGKLAYNKYKYNMKNYEKILLAREPIKKLLKGNKNKNLLGILDLLGYNKRISESTYTLLQLIIERYLGKLIEIAKIIEITNNKKSMGIDSLKLSYEIFNKCKYM